MKASGIFISLLILVFRLHAQNVENPSFDSVYIGGIDRIHSWITSDAWPTSSGDTVLPLSPSQHYIATSLQYHEALRTVQIDYSTAFDGNYSAKILSFDSLVKKDGLPFRGFITNGDHFYTDSSGYIDLAKGGTPFPYRPYQFRGHYKFEDFSPSLNNYPHGIVLLKKYNSISQRSDTIGFASFSVQLFPIGNWRLFEIPINYLSSQVPDSLVIAFLSPGIGFPSTLWIDSLGFDYLNSTSIYEVESKIDFYQDYENNKICFLNSGSIASINIFTASGQLVLKDSSPKSIIDISVFPEGIYLLSLEFVNHKSKTYRIKN